MFFLSYIAIIVFTSRVTFFPFHPLDIAAKGVHQIIHKFISIPQQKLKVIVRMQLFFLFY